MACALQPTHQSTDSRIEFPEIAERMFNDGLIALLTSKGLRWFSGRYRVSAKVVRDMWGLSEHQFKRFKRWVYMTDAFMEFQEGEPDDDDRI